MDHVDLNCSCGKPISITAAQRGFFICDDCYKVEIAMLLEYKKTRKLIPSLDLIVDNLYLGNEDAAISKEILTEKNISHIVVAGDYLDTPFSEDSMYTYKNFALQDFPDQNIRQHFEEAIKFIHTSIKEGKNVLVHCAAGISRSSTIIIAYLMFTKSWTADEAFLFVKSKRSIICPNSGFRNQLTEFEKEIKEKIFQLILE